MWFDLRIPVCLWRARGNFSIHSSLINSLGIGTKVMVPIEHERLDSTRQTKFRFSLHISNGLSSRLASELIWPHIPWGKKNLVSTRKYLANFSLTRSKEGTSGHQWRDLKKKWRSSQKTPLHGDKSIKSSGKVCRRHNTIGLRISAKKEKSLMSTTTTARCHLKLWRSLCTGLESPSGSRARSWTGEATDLAGPQTNTEGGTINKAMIMKLEWRTLDIYHFISWEEMMYPVQTVDARNNETKLIKMQEKRNWWMKTVVSSFSGS